MLSGFITKLTKKRKEATGRARRGGGGGGGGREGEGEGEREKGVTRMGSFVLQPVDLYFFCYSEHGGPF